MLSLLGRLHPVLVHLPIGILLLACLFLWQSKKVKYQHLQPSIRLILLLGMWSAIASCITGYLLYDSGDYPEGSVSLHEWMGITVALISIFIYFFQKKSLFQQWQLPAAFLLTLLIFITGHLGGSITHGEDYLSSPLQSIFGKDTLATVQRKALPNAQQAQVYADIIQPIFQEKCEGCHSARRQKGKLRLDRPDLILRGGKDGPVIVAGKPGESELIKRILLPPEDEHHMAPKGKPALSASEILLLKWWVENGADFTHMAKDFPQTPPIKAALTALQNTPVQKRDQTGLPPKPVEEADASAVEALKNAGVMVFPVAQNSHYLAASFLTVTGNLDSITRLLLPIKKQLAWLRLSHSNTGDSTLSILADCSNLTRLELDHTLITDKGLAFLNSLSQLQILNLVGTNISLAGLLKLQNLKQLQEVYLYETHISKMDWSELKSRFPNVNLDSGGYTLPYLEQDTQLVKAPKLK